MKAIIKIAGHVVGEVDLKEPISTPITPDDIQVKQIASDMWCATYVIPKASILHRNRNIVKHFGLSKIRLPRKLKKKLKKQYNGLI